jgi:acetyltransferase
VDLPRVDPAILVVAAKYSLQTVEELAYTKGTRAFIIISAGFSEENETGKEPGRKIVR